MTCCSSTANSQTGSYTDQPVVVIGAGPIGLATTVHLLERGLTPLLIEQGPRAGYAIEQWKHIRLFSPWRYNIDKLAAQLLEKQGWEPPRPTAVPYGHEFLESYIYPLAKLERIAQVSRYSTKVVAISRRGMDKTRTRNRAQAPFAVRLVDGQGQESEILASAIIDASGTFFSPNALGASGLPVLGEKASSSYITRPLPDVLGNQRHQLEGKRVAVLGAGHSAVNTLLLLHALRQESPTTEIHWLIRRPSPESVYGGGNLDELPARGQLGVRLRRLIEGGGINLHTSFSLHRMVPQENDVHLISENGEELEVDVLVPATGFRPDLSLTQELRLDLDQAVEAPRKIASLIDPEFHSCGTVEAHGEKQLRHTETNFYIVGMKSYGRAPTFLMATGYEQVRSIVAHLAGDTEGSTTLELNLPATGVCSAAAGTTC